MTKTSSRIKLVLVAILTVIGMLLTFVSFVIPTTNTTFRGFAGAINYGYDIAGGRLSVFEAQREEGMSDSEFEIAVNTTVDRYQSVFAGYGLEVSGHVDNSGEKTKRTIRIVVSNFDDEKITNMFSKSGLGTDLFSSMASESGISLNKSTSSDAEGSITGKYFKKCYVQAGSYGSTDLWSVVIEFNDEGQEMLRNMTTGASESDKLYLYVNGQNILYDSNGGQGRAISETGAISSLTLSYANEEFANTLALQINSLAKPVILKKVVDNNITSGLSTSVVGIFGNVKTMLIVGLVAMVVGVMLFLSIRYRMFGALASWSMLVFVAIFAFLLQSIPLVVMDINGVLGVVATFLILVSSMVQIFEKIRKEYASGKKIPNAIRAGFKKNVLPTLEKYSFLLILLAVCYIVGTQGIKHMACVLFVGLFVNYFTLFVMLRGVCACYMVLNSTKKGLYNLKREAVRNEI